MSKLSLFLCGDVMTGRGIDQILRHPGDSRILESALDDARDYVRLAERQCGPIPRSVDFNYVWGDALAELTCRSPDLRIINLETSITLSDAAEPKGINYRMHPRNVPCLQAAGIDCCGLANNHVLDWGQPGLLETLSVLRDAGIATAGAGKSLREARAAARLQASDPGRVLVYAIGTPSSGIPEGWAARDDQPGVWLLRDFSERSVAEVGQQVRLEKRPGDIALASIHWGSNWGYPIPAEHRSLAHALIDEAFIDLVHGHSSHHPLGIEVHGGKLILYGCGDFLNDYEGINSKQSFRSELALMYFATLDTPSGMLAQLELVPVRMRRFRLERAAPDDTHWLEAMLNREGAALGTRVEHCAGGSFRLAWTARASHSYDDHPGGGLRLRVDAPTLAGLFAEAGRALTELQLEGAAPHGPGAAERVFVSAGDCEALLVAWLNELIYLSETRGSVAVDFAFEQLSEHELSGHLRLVPIQVPKSTVKAATYRELEVRRTDVGFSAHLVLDV